MTLLTERVADYLRWVAPSLVVLVGYPLVLILACYLTACATRRWLLWRHEIQTRPQLLEEITHWKGVAEAAQRAAEIQKQAADDLRARIRENRALASQLAINYEVVRTE